MTPHDAMLDAVAAYALGAVSRQEAAEVREHLQTCAECRQEYRLLQPAVTALAYSAEASAATASGASAPSPLLKARLMKHVRGSVTPSSAPKRSAAWSAYALAAACLALALVSGLLNLSLRERLRGAQAQLSAQQQTIAADLSLRERFRDQQAQMAAQRQMIADSMAPDSIRHPFQHGEVLTRGQRLYIAMHDMPMPPHGKVYQAWTLSKGAKKMTPSTTFMPSSGGTTIVPLSLNTAVAAVAVSVEPQGGSQQPTSKPVAVVMLQ